MLESKKSILLRLEAKLDAHTDLQQGQIRHIHEDLGALTAWRQRYSAELGRMKEETMTIREDLDKMRQEVNDTKTVSAGAVTAIEGVSQLVKDLQAKIDSNPDMTAEEISAELGQMASELDSSQQALANAIANVPQAGGGSGGQTQAERAAAEGNATLQQPNSPTG